MIKATGATSISWALVDGTTTVWSTTVGVVDEADTKPNASTLYGIGSVSKMLTAISVMQLVDAGKVSLDAPVTDYVTDFRMASAADAHRDPWTDRLPVGRGPVGTGARRSRSD